jgi:hypothetical protein
MGLGRGSSPSRLRRRHSPAGARRVVSRSRLRVAMATVSGPTRGTKAEATSSTEPVEVVELGVKRRKNDTARIGWTTRELVKGTKAIEVSGPTPAGPASVTVQVGNGPYVKAHSLIP